MTYLNLVNDVLIRLREDTIDSVGGSSSALLDDPVAYMVKQFVNDAKRVVEQAHTWNALRAEWTISTAQGTHTYALADSGDSVVLEEILSSEGHRIAEAPISKIRRDALTGGENTPCYYAASGVDANLNLQIRLSPVPKGTSTFYVYGYKAQPDLQEDTDLCLVPSKPVVYTAMAMAARERGEVGGQTSTDLLRVAQSYMSDAIAIDAATNSLDDIWYS
tara:strand:+ start:729 stop:1385 length:657 start_codon:yes stop_codon:yes gene_type:complete